MERQDDQVPEFSTKALQLQALEAKQVIVYIWTSAGNPINPGHTVGHVSVKTPNGYYSLWPSAEGKEHGRGIVQAIAHEFKPNYEADLKVEDRPPELVFCFYTLDPNLMDAEFAKMTCKLVGWNLTGLGKDGESCVSSAWKLLEAGGIKKLVSGLDRIATSSKGSGQGSSNATGKGSEVTFFKVKSQPDRADEASQQSKAAVFYATEMVVSPLITSPDFVGELLKKAKLNELEMNPLISELKFPNETDVRKDTSSKCNIM